MATIVANEQLAAGIFRMTVAGDYRGEMGQFYMVRCDDGYRADSYPLLSRPLSIHERGREGIVFLYRVHGRGTELLSRQMAGQHVLLEGPFGTGFPVVDVAKSNGKRIALVGGGMGVAPLLPVAQHYRHADVYLGYSGTAFAVDSFKKTVVHSEQVQVMNDARRSVLELLDTGRYDCIMACGPAGMLRALAEQCGYIDTMSEHIHTEWVSKEPMSHHSLATASVWTATETEQTSAEQAVVCSSHMNTSRMNTSRINTSSMNIENKMSMLQRPALYVSIERRMACGLGACLTCTVRTHHGNRRTCQEGPVFHAEEVCWDEFAHL